MEQAIYFVRSFTKDFSVSVGSDNESGSVDRLISICTKCIEDAPIVPESSAAPMLDFGKKAISGYVNTFDSDVKPLRACSNTEKNFEQAITAYVIEQPLYKDHFVVKEPPESPCKGIWNKMASKAQPDSMNCDFWVVVPANECSVRKKRLWRGVALRAVMKVIPSYFYQAKSLQKRDFGYLHRTKPIIYFSGMKRVY